MEGAVTARAEGNQVDFMKKHFEKLILLKIKKVIPGFQRMVAT